MHPLEPDPPPSPEEAAWIEIVAHGVAVSLYGAGAGVIATIIDGVTEAFLFSSAPSFHGLPGIAQSWSYAAGNPVAGALVAAGIYCGCGALLGAAAGAVWGAVRWVRGSTGSGGGAHGRSV